MLKERIKKLLIYCVIFSMIMQNLLYTPLIANAMEPGTITKKITLTPGETFILDTRYNYKIKKSEFIEYCKSYINKGDFFIYSSSGEIEATSADDINWDEIVSYGFNKADIGDESLDMYSSNYDALSSNNVRARITNEYLTFDFYSQWGFISALISAPVNSSDRSILYPICVYDADNKELMITMWQTGVDPVAGYLGKEVADTDDVDFKYIGDFEQGDIVKANEIAIYNETKYKSFKVKLVSINDTSNVINSDFPCDSGKYHYGVSGNTISWYLQFDDTYPQYIFVERNTNTDTFTFAVDESIKGSIRYVDYFSGDTIYEEMLYEGVTPTIYNNSEYGVWINSETNEVLKEEDLKAGLTVYGMPVTIESTITDCTYWYDYDVFYINWVLNTNNINNLDDIVYDLDRISEFDEVNYPVIGLGYHLYKTSSLSAKDLKPYYDEIIYSFRRYHNSWIYNGENGNVVNKTDAIWSYSKVNGININDENVYYLGELKQDSFVYELHMSDEAKNLYQNLFVRDCITSAYIPYNNYKYLYYDVYNGWRTINATKEGTSPTCTQDGLATYKIAYNFTNTYYLRTQATKFNKEDFSLNTSILSDNNTTSISTHNKSNMNYLNYIFFKCIDSFDELANPYILETYGIRQYESLYLYDKNNRLYFEMYPSYENNEVYYNIKFNYNKKYKESEKDWDRVFKFNTSTQEGINGYNEWLKNYGFYSINDDAYGIYFYNVFYVTANRNNPYHTFDDSSLEAQVNAMEFNLDGSNDGTTTVPSTFLKTSSDDKFYIVGVDYYGGANYTTSISTDALGHKWEDDTWNEVDVNNILNNTDIINANNNVVDLDTLIEYAENDIDRTLLNDSNNKLYYKLCNRAGDAYELEVRVPHIHTYKEPVFTWNDDNSDCTATFECVNGDDTQILDCIVSSNRTEPNCTENGKITYTASVEFNNQTFSDTKEVPLEKNGHTYKEPVFTWDDDNSCDATFECIEGDDTKTVDCIVTSHTTNATCTVDGKTVYTATVTFDNKTYTDTKEVVIGASGHTYSYPTFAWDEDNSCTATFVCQKNDDTQVLDCEVTSKITNPLCITKGKIVYTAKVTFKGNEYTDTKEVDIVPNGHKYNEPVFNWSEDNSSCTATFNCKSADDTKVLDCEISSQTIKATCTVDGKIIYTATVEFENKVYSDTKEVIISASGHTYNEPTFAWNDDNECVATFKCIKNDDTQIIDCTMTSKTTEPTCIVNGKTVYTATVTFNNAIYTDNKEVPINAAGHKYNEPIFIWDDENNCKATFICKKSDDTQVLDCAVTSKITNPLCVTKGKIIYTAKVTFEGVEYTDTKEIDLAPNGHKYNEPVFNWSNNNTCTATFECIKGDDIRVLDCIVTSTTFNPTCTVDGKIIYTATVTFNNRTYTDIKEVSIKALGHTYNEPTFIWADDYSCVAMFKCIKNDDTKNIDCDVISKVTNATCTTDGKTVYTATVTFDDKTYADTKEVVIGASGHTYNYPTFTWDDDNNCKATFICKKNDDTQVLDCTVTSKITNPLCIIKGKIVYTANVTFDDKTYTDTKEVDILPNGHEYKEPVFTWSNDNSCTATFDCESADDTKILDCIVTSKTTNATCTVDGKIIYTATVELENVIYTDTKIAPIKALDHEFGSWYEVKAPTYDEDGLLQRDCIRNDKSETKPINKLIKTATVNGVLKDENGKPIANKKVEMHSNPRYTYTDENGYFEFKDIELGEHTLKVFNTDNAIICELALTLDKVESSVEEKQVDDGFKWDKEINESDVSLTIDGLKVENSTKETSEETTVAEETSEETTAEESTESSTEKLTEQNSENETAEITTTETIIEQSTKDELNTEQTTTQDNTQDTTSSLEESTTEKENPEDKMTTSKQIKDEPDTGDTSNNNLYILLMMFSAIACGFITLVAKKETKTDN